MGLAIVSLVVSACLAAVGGLATAGTIVTQAQNQRMSSLLNRGPLDIYVATGPENACGPGCSEWIAVEGKIDVGSGRRFRAFLDSERRRKLPVFFHTQGGVLADGIEIGQLLRDYQMTAGVGRTAPAGCTVARLPGGNCDKLVKSGNAVPSQLVFDGGQCHSACVFALAGATTRKIAAGAVIGIHAPATDEQMWKRHVDKFPGAQRLSEEERHQGLWRLALGFGIDPDVVDLARKISNKSLYLLNREEIARFGFQTGDRFETRWFARGEPGSKFSLLKAVSTANSDGNGLSTTVFQFNCAAAGGYRLTVFSPLPGREIWPQSYARLHAGETSLALSTGSYGRNADAHWVAVAQIVGFQNIAAEREAKFTINFNSDAHPPRTTSFSTSGLAAALRELQNNCGHRKVT
ncbi:MAG TPA: hypothetical protein VM867_10145 [Xanthobacteraceae bacterium]|nr:hypothetical protein [Xanthobacteraceae bacterium]